MVLVTFVMLKVFYSSCIKTRISFFTREFILYDSCLEFSNTFNFEEMLLY